MNGELAQVVTLATHGTAWLRKPQPPPPHLDETHETFQFVASLEFRMESARKLLLRRRPVTDVATWLDRLHRRGMTRLRLAPPRPRQHQVGSHSVGDHTLAAFSGGGGRWLLVATGGKSSEFWWPDWKVGDRDAADSRIWNVTYTGKAQVGVSFPDDPSLEQARDRLWSCLYEIHAFALETDVSPWPDLFSRAIASIEAGPPERTAHSDMVPDGYPEDARRLLVSAAQSWVFGGMGSWNDLAFDTRELEDRYDRLSRELYAAILSAITAAVNTEL